MKKIQYLIVLFFVSFLIVSCANATEGGSASNVTGSYTFRSVAGIIDGDLEVTNFANDGSATLPIVTNVPVACTIVYGTTAQFGSLSLDQDMAGGTHSDHSPLLTGLEPETEYFFRVQGIDEDGIIYLSEVMTFTTPVFTSSSETDNLAAPERGAIIMGYSSAFGNAGPDARWGVLSAFDNNPNTEWSSAGDGNDAWVAVELAERARIDTVSFQSRAMGDGTAIALAFTVTTDSGETFGPFELPDAENVYDFETSIEAKTVRFDLLDTTGGNTGAVDIAIYGDFLGEE